MALLGADLILYPTAIGTEPQDATINSADHWQRVMQGHSAANVSRVQKYQVSFHDESIIFLTIESYSVQRWSQ